MLIEMPTLGRSSRRRLAALMALTLLAAVRGDAQVQSGQTLLGDDFAAASTRAPVLTLNASTPQFPCLTAGAAGGPAPSSIPNCQLPSPDPAGQGALRFTDSGEQQASAIVYETSIPTAQGLTMTFRQYQHGGHGLDGPGSPGGGDGISFFLAVAPPQPQGIGQQGGGLGYTSFFDGPGLPGAWLGIGLDAFGNFSSPDFGDAACPRPAWAGSSGNQIVVRGPGHGTTGYCLLSSSIQLGDDDNPVGQFGVGLRGSDRASSMRTIQVVIDPVTSTYAVGIDPAGGTNFVLATSGPLPTTYYDPSTGTPVAGIPPRVTFGFSASTGTATDIHEINSLEAETLNGAVPVLGLTKTHSVTGTVAPGTAFDYTITPRIAGSVTEAAPLSIRVSDTLPDGVTISGNISGAAWICQPTGPASFQCSYQNPAPIPAGTTLPPITVPVTLADGVPEGTVVTNTATVLSSDAATPVSASSSVTVATAPPPLAITTTTLPGGTSGVAYAATTLNATGGTPPLMWSIASGALPAGLALSSAGVLGGTPTAAGSFSVTVRVADNTGGAATRAFSFAILAPLSITTASVPNGTVAVAYAATTLAATGGSGTRTWSIAAGGVAPGMALSAAGTLTGTPTAAGTYSFTARVVDTGGGAATRALSLMIAAAPLSITTGPLPAGGTGTAYSTTLAAAGGVTPYSWTRASGTLPTGVTLSAAGVLSGTPTATGSFTFTARVTDAAQTTATRAFTVTVSQLVITTTTVPAGRVLTAYSTTLRATGGSGTLRWSIASGALPGALTLTTTGVLAGMPTASGTFTFTVRVTDATNATTTQALALSIAAVPPVITTLTLPVGEVGLAYAVTLSATGGSQPLTWSVDAGSLPAGLVLAPTGIIAGTPTTDGLARFTVRATGASGGSATRVLAINVFPALAITTTSVPDVSVGYPYRAPIERTGGRSVYTWSIASGALPAGLLLGPAGVIHGRSTTLGTSTVTLRLTDGLGAVVTRSFTIRVVRPEKAYVGLLESGAARCRRPGQPCRAALGVVNTATGEVLKELPLAAPTLGFSGVVASPDGRRVYFTTHSFVAVDRLYELNTETDTVARSVAMPLGGQIIHVSPDGSLIFLRSGFAAGGQPGSRLIVMSAMSLQTLRMHDFPNVNGWPSLSVMTTDGRTIYWATAAHFDGGLNGTYYPAEILAIDSATGQLSDRFTLGDYSPVGLALTPNGGRLLVSTQQPSMVLDVSVSSRAVAQEIPAPLMSFMYVPDNLRLYGPTASSGGSSIARFSLASNALEREIPINGIPIVCGLDAIRANLYCTTIVVNGVNQAALTRIDLDTDTATLLGQFSTTWTAVYTAIAPANQ